MPRLIHLSGPPGIGKSTLARRYVDDHPGVLNCDIDVLRSLIGGSGDDFAGTGALLRPAALSMIEAYLRNDRDVVLPQMLVDLEEVDLFEACAARAGAHYVPIFLMDDVEASVARFHRRGSGAPADPWHDEVRRIVAANGGDLALAAWHANIEKVIAERADGVVIRSVEDDIDATYQYLLDALS